MGHNNGELVQTATTVNVVITQILPDKVFCWLSTWKVPVFVTDLHFLVSSLESADMLCPCDILPVQTNV